MSVLDWLMTPPPDVAVEIDRTHVGAVRLERRGGRATVAAHAVEALPAGAVTPALAASNMPDVAAVGQVVSRVLSQLGGRTHRIALVVPDSVAKVSLLRLEKVPGKEADLREIVRWQIRKSAPFPVEQAVLSVSPGAPGVDGGRELVVALAREDVIRQYEQACAMAGAHAGIVDLATFGVLNSVVAGGGAPSGDWLLVHVADTRITLAVMRGGHLIFFRHRSEESEGTLADLMHQTAMYYEDRLSGAGFQRVWLAGTAEMGDGDLVRRDLESRIGRQVELVDPRAAAALADRIDPSPELADALTPLVGVLRRDVRRPDMEPINLSTRPFYNGRLVRVVLGLLTLLVLGLAAFNVVQVMRLTSRDAEVRSQAERAEADAARLRSQAAAIRQTINRDQLSAVQAAAREANQLIDRRAFSWTDLFNRFEATLPGSVRIASVTPQVDQQGRMLVAVTVISRRVEDLDGFIEALEKTGAFQEVLSRQEEAQVDGTLRSIIQGYYHVANAPPQKAAAPAPAEPSEAPATPAPTTTRTEGER